MSSHEVWCFSALVAASFFFLDHVVCQVGTPAFLQATVHFLGPPFAGNTGCQKTGAKPFCRTYPLWELFCRAHAQGEALWQDLFFQQMSQVLLVLFRLCWMCQPSSLLGLGLALALSHSLLSPSWLLLLGLAPGWTGQGNGKGNMYLESQIPWAPCLSIYFLGGERCIAYGKTKVWVLYVILWKLSCF